MGIVLETDALENNRKSNAKAANNEHVLGRSQVS